MTLTGLISKLRKTPFLPLDFEISESALLADYQSIVESGHPLQSYQTNYRLVRNYYAKSWSGICLISSDGGLYTDLSEGDIQRNLKNYSKTPLEDICPYLYDLIDGVNHSAVKTRARIMRIAPKRSLLWHSHVLEHGQPDHILTVQIPIIVPAEFEYCVVHKDEMRWFKRFFGPNRFKSLQTAKLKSGKAYIFNSYHFHNVYNNSKDEHRITLMVYLDLRYKPIQKMVERSFNKYQNSVTEMVYDY